MECCTSERVTEAVGRAEGISVGHFLSLPGISCAREPSSTALGNVWRNDDVVRTDGKSTCSHDSHEGTSDENKESHETTGLLLERLETLPASTHDLNNNLTVPEEQTTQLKSGCSGRMQTLKNPYDTSSCRKVADCLASTCSGTKVVDCIYLFEGGEDLRRVSSAEDVYHIIGVVGKGSFGVVYKGKLVQTNETVAIKLVIQNARYKCREYCIMKELQHPNIVKLADAFLTPPYSCLHLVMNFMPLTLHNVIRSMQEDRKLIPLLIVKYYTYQLCRALGYLHQKHICHRDLKPDNILLDPATHHVQLCDFGTAKRLAPREFSVSYVCSRYYRAPELILGAVDYTEQVDTWSLGCVLAEMLLGRPLFTGSSGIDQLIRIIKIMGTPTPAELLAMNPSYAEYALPPTKSVPWSSIFSCREDPQATDLVSRFLQFNPKLRLRPIDALSHPFFDELRLKDVKLPDTSMSPPHLFDFVTDEVEAFSCSTKSLLIPEWMKEAAVE